MKKTFWQKLEVFPPIACRLLARVKTDTGGVRAMTALEIATKAGMTEMKVNSLSWVVSWDGVPVSDAKAFTEACGIFLSDRASLRTHSAYVRRNAPWKYLKKSPEWSTVFRPMIMAYVKHVSS